MLMESTTTSNPRAVSAARHSILVPLRTTGTKKPLFLVPGVFITPEDALQDAQFIRQIRLVQALGDDLPVYGLRTLLLGGRLQKYRSVEQMATEYAELVQAVQPQGPYLFSGMCIGGVFAFEIARQLSDSSQQVNLVLLDTSYPCKAFNKILMKDGHQRLTLRFFANQWGRCKKLVRIMLERKAEFRERISEVATRAASAREYERSSEHQFWETLHAEKNHLERLVMNYQPRPFSGTINLITTDTFDLGLFDQWKTIAKQGVMEHRIPATSGKHFPGYLETAVKVIRPLAVAN
jgi:thioesterase domain-containing protein